MGLHLLHVNRKVLRSYKADYSKGKAKRKILGQGPNIPSDDKIAGQNVENATQRQKRTKWHFIFSTFLAKRHQAYPHHRARQRPHENGEKRPLPPQKRPEHGDELDIPTAHSSFGNERNQIEEDSP